MRKSIERMSTHTLCACQRIGRSPAAQASAQVRKARENRVSDRLFGTHGLNVVACVERVGGRQVSKCVFAKDERRGAAAALGGEARLKREVEAHQ